MILRRVIDHVRTQNWLAVSLDFLIVVLGVFIGIQLGNWNEARQVRAGEARNLERLQDEAELAVAYWQQRVDLAAGYNESRRTFLAILAAGRMEAGQEAAVTDALMSMMFYPANNPPRAVLDEVIASGGFANISDVEAREALSDYVAQVDFVNGQLPQFRSNFPQFFEAYRGRVFSVYDPAQPSLRRYEYDLAALSRDREFKSAMTDLVRDQLQFQTYRVTVLHAAQEMCDVLSAATDTLCEPRADTLHDWEGVNRRVENVE